MNVRISSLIRTLFYTLKYGHRIVFNGLPSLHKNAKINIVKGKMVVGRSFTAKPGAYFAVMNGGELCLKENVYFGRNCISVCHDSIIIGENCRFGPNVTIYDHDHCFGKNGVENGFKTSPIFIGDNCWIGAGVFILRGARIGEGSVIGAGCVVKGVIPPHSLVTSERAMKIVPLEEVFSEIGSNEKNSV